MPSAPFTWPESMQRRPWEPQDGDMKCQSCFGRNPVWWAESEVWNAVMGNEGGVLCPTCFILLASSRGLFRSGAWQLYPPADLRAKK